MATPWERAWLNPWVRGMLLFSAFRAVYGIGILVVTYLLVTNDATPWWTSIVFLVFSMIFSRWLFRIIKRRWPKVFNPREEEASGEPVNAQTTP